MLRSIGLIYATVLWLLSWCFLWMHFKLIAWLLAISYVLTMTLLTQVCLSLLFCVARVCLIPVWVYCFVLCVDVLLSALISGYFWSSLYCCTTESRTVKYWYITSTFWTAFAYVNKIHHIVFGQPFVKRFTLCYQTVDCPVCLSVTLAYCGQTVWRIKMKLGMQVGLGRATLC